MATETGPGELHLESTPKHISTPEGLSQRKEGEVVRRDGGKAAETAAAETAAERRMAGGGSGADVRGAEKEGSSGEGEVAEKQRHEGGGAVKDNGGGGAEVKERERERRIGEEKAVGREGVQQSGDRRTEMEVKAKDQRVPRERRAVRKERSVEVNGKAEEQCKEGEIQYTKELTARVELVGDGAVSVMELFRGITGACGEATGCRLLGDRKYEITMRNSRGKEKLLEGFKIGNIQVLGSDLNCNEMVVSFLQLPVYLPDQVLIDRLLSWGVEAVSPIKRRMWPGTSLSDGTRYVKVRFTAAVQSLPYSTRFDTAVGSDFFRVIHDRQVRVCRLCIKPGHILRECPEFTCFRCKGQGHYARECTRDVARSRECGDCEQQLCVCGEEAVEERRAGDAAAPVEEREEPMEEEDEEEDEVVEETDTERGGGASADGGRLGSSLDALEMDSNGLEIPMTQAPASMAGSGRTSSAPVSVAPVSVPPGQGRGAQADIPVVASTSMAKVEGERGRSCGPVRRERLPSFPSEDSDFDDIGVKVSEMRRARGNRPRTRGGKGRDW